MIRMILVTLVVFGFTLGECAAESAYGRIVHWRPYPMVKEATLIVKGTVTWFSYLKEESIRSKNVDDLRFFEVGMTEVIKGVTTDTEIYLMEPAAALSVNPPPELDHMVEYVLFLKPKADDAGLIRRMGAEKLPTFETVRKWKGAVAFGKNSGDKSSFSIQRQFGLDTTSDGERFVAALKDFVRYFEESDKTKRKAMLDDFVRKQDPLYASFLEDVQEAEK